jgi:hypothetical protein
MGHDSERAAIIYQHEAQGADLAITDAIDAHIEAVMASGDGPPGGPPRLPNGPLMAMEARMIQAPSQTGPLTCGFLVERVTRIELALSAWE